MMTRSYQFPFNELNLPRPDLEMILGFGQGVLPDPFPEMIDEVLHEAPARTHIIGGCAIHSQPAFENHAKIIRIGNTNLHTESLIGNRLRGAEALAVFLCTAGEGIETWSREETKKGDPVKAFIIDSLGSLTVETAMDMIQALLGKEMESQGMNITNRYSPGYCHWHLSDQFNLFSLLPPGFCGVKLTDSALMRPIKSVSGVIGIGHSVEKKEYECSICDREDCIYRQLKLAKTHAR